MKKLAPLAAFLLVVAFAMSATASISFAQGKSGEKGNAYGHFIAPGWLKKNDAPSSEGLTLPTGIKKLLGMDEEPEEDTTAPVISDVVVVDTDTTMTVSWETDEPAHSTVYVSTSTPVDPAHGDTVAVSDVDLEMVHETLVDGLAASTTYYGYIKVTDGSGNTSTSSEFSFVTDESPDTDGPVISNIVLDVGTTTLDVDWTTDEPATSAAYVSTTTGFALADAGVTTVLNPALTSDHTLSFAGLNASTTYYLRVQSTDASANTALSNQVMFTTF